jgi:hypothetical protein
MTTTLGPVSRPITKFRDRRQRFDPSAEFVWRRRLQVSHTDGPKGKRKPIFASPGDPVDKASLVGAAKLRRLWEAEYIELRDWELPSRGILKVVPQPDAPADGSIRKRNPRVASLGGGWYEVTSPTGEKTKVQGLVKAEETAACFDEQTSLASEPGETSPPEEEAGDEDEARG